MLTVSRVRVDMYDRPLSLDDPAPLFSWKVSSDIPEDAQSAYQLTVRQGETLLWDSGRVESKETLHIPYGGPALAPHTRYTVQVSVWNRFGGQAESEPAFWRTGYMGEPWSARWITPDPVGRTQTSPLLRRAFSLKTKPADAIICVCTTGWYELYVNGKKADDRVLTPTAAPHGRRVYDTYDIAALLHKGDNVIGLWMGDGYNSQFVKWGWRYDDVKTAIAELRVTYADGESDLIPTDGAWDYTLSSPLLNNGVYAGEYFDARKETPWCDPSVPITDWTPVTVLEKPAGDLEPTPLPPIRVTEHLQVKKYWRAGGKLILDFGQNIAGWVKVRLHAAPGQVISLHFAEEIDPATKKLDPFTNRTAKATDTFVFRGHGVEEYEPHFTYHGFRYAEVSGFSGRPGKDTFTACVVHTDMPFTADLQTDSEEINRLYSNVRWTVRDNGYTYPTDCPMRDERTPCSHDVVNYAEVAMFTWDVSAYYRNFVYNKMVPADKPDYEECAIEISWLLYRWYGDKRHLERVYPTLIAMMHHYEDTYKDNICHGGGDFGDWCAPKDNADGSYACAFSYARPNNTAYIYLQTKQVADIADVLGHYEDAAWLRGRLPLIAEAYHKNFYDAEHHWYDEGEQTAGALPLYFGMVPEDKKAEILRSVVEGVRDRRKNHLDTGIFGTRFTPMMLADNGYIDLAFDAFFNPTYPSFGYEFSKGATTVWEQWWERGGMTSHNHGMFCGGATVLFRHLLGFHDYRSAGRRVEIKPVLSRRVKKLSGWVDTLRGKYHISYTRTDRVLKLTVTVPCGCDATVILPDGTKAAVSAGVHKYKCKIRM